MVLPAATMPYGFLGSWVPDPKVYGKLISPPINVTKANWPDGGLQTAASPQFATDKGQQIGSKYFFPYGTLGHTVGSTQVEALGNAFDKGYPMNRYGAPHIYGPKNEPVEIITFAQVEAPDNWEQIEGEPFVPLNATLNATKPAVKK